MTELILKATAGFIILRAAQRIFYHLRTGHQHQHYPWTYSPRQALNQWLEELLIKGKSEADECNQQPRQYSHPSPKIFSPELPWIQHPNLSTHSIKSSVDGIEITYRRLGNGPRVFLLANGVGTDFFMWFPAMQYAVKNDPNLFDKITLIVPIYRGLLLDYDALTPYEKQPMNIAVTIDNCVQDIVDVLHDCQKIALATGNNPNKYDCLQGLLGWSTGSQIAIRFAIQHNEKVKTLFLLNSPVGETLYTAFQPFCALPRPIGGVISTVTHVGITQLKKLINTPVWPFLRNFALSYPFHVFLMSLAYLSGSPPEQAVYFHEYMKDVFKNRTHTKALLDLILSLDEKADHDAIANKIHQYSVIVSGSPDFLSGVYHSYLLEKLLKNRKHVNFKTGSHFLLLEWPEYVGKELALFFNHGVSN